MKVAGVFILLLFVVVSLGVSKFQKNHKEKKERQQREEKAGKDAGMSWEEYTSNRR